MTVPRSPADYGNHQPTAGNWYVVVVIVTHRGPSGTLRACLCSIDGAGSADPADAPDAVVVVDNSEPAPGRTARRPGCYGRGVAGLVTMPNRGYGAAANRGIDWARARTPPGKALAVALLNDDIEVEPGWLAPLVAALDDEPRLGAVQPKLMLSDGVRVNSLGVELDRHFAGVDIGFEQPDGPGWQAPRSVTACTGGAVLLRGGLLDDVGGFDERWFLYYEDVDLALRGAASGWRYRCEPGAVVRHVRGATTDDLGPRRRWLQERNRLWCAVRHAPARTVALAFSLSVRRLRHRPRRAHARALLSGLLGSPAMLAGRLRSRSAGVGGPVGRLPSSADSAVPAPAASDRNGS